MSNVEYRYFILEGLGIARLEKGKYSLDSKEFYIDGAWIENDKLNLQLNDCIMDYGDSRWYEYDDISEEEAYAYIEKEIANKK